MIFVRDKGRLCNNILQYGHLYAWGREHGRNTMSMRFAYKYRYFHICHTPYHNFAVYLFAKYAAKWGLLPIADFGVDAPNDPDQQEQLLLSHNHIVAQGWYARWYDLFLKYKQDIIALFQFDEKLKLTVNRRLASLPAADVRLGMHVRRGDYRTWHNGCYFFTDEQYINLIRQFLSLHEGKRIQVFICGNDPELDEDSYRQALAIPDLRIPDLRSPTRCLSPTRSLSTPPSIAPPRHRATAPPSLVFPKGNPGEDLYLLSQCDYLIGPPSTFTLVAAMYHDRPLCWVEDADMTLSPSSFAYFDELFQKIK